MLFHTLTLGKMDNKCYILTDEKTQDTIMFDAPFESVEIMSYLDSNKLNLKYIVMTHAHFDHMCALYNVKMATGAEVCIHQCGSESLINRSINLTFHVSPPPPVVYADRYLADGEVIRLGNINCKVLHTPGHTADSICVYVTQRPRAQGNILISGDTLFRREVGRCDHPTGNFKQLVESIKNKLYILPDDTIVYPGHGMPTTIGEEKQENPYVRDLS